MRPTSRLLSLSTYAATLLAGCLVLTAPVQAKGNAHPSHSNGSSKSKAKARKHTPAPPKGLSLIHI